MHQRLRRVIEKTSRHLENSAIRRENVCVDQVLFRMIEGAAPSAFAAEAKAALTFHAKCREAGFSDGRVFYQYVLNNDIVGLCGYQRRIADPSDVVWGGFSVMAPTLHASLKLGVFCDVIRVLANQTAYNKLYVEIFSDRAQSNMMALCEAMALPRMGLLHDFYGSGQDMTIALLDLAQLRESLATPVPHATLSRNLSAQP